MKSCMLSVFLFLYLPLQSQNIETLKIYSFEEVEQLQKKNQKPLLVFIYTDWCKVCYGMKKTTFNNSNVIQLLNKKYYLLMLNGEEKKDISFLDKTFTYKPAGNNTGVHELAKALGSINGKMSYPTLILLNSKFQIELQIDSFINSKKMNALLTDYLLEIKKR